MKIVKKEKIERYIKTFIEAFASYIAVNVAMADFSSIDAVKGLLVGAIASAISVALNIEKSNKNNEE